MIRLQSLNHNQKKVFCLIGLILLTSIFIFIPLNSFAQDITKYEECLDSKEYTELKEAVKNLKDLQQATNERLEGYIPKAGVKDESFEAFCKLPNLPIWVTGICKTYDFGQGYNKKFKNTIMNGVSFIPGSGVNNQYRKYLRDNKKACEEPVQLIHPKDYPWRLPSTTTKDTGLVYLLVYKGWQKYCEKIKKTEEKIEELKQKCTVVPNVTGKCLDKARRELWKVGLYAVTDVKSADLKKNESRWEIYKQSPLPGTLAKKSSKTYVSNVKVKIRSHITDITVKPSSWLDAAPGAKPKQIDAKAYFKCGTPLDLTDGKAGVWKSSNNKVAAVKNGIVTIKKDAKNGQEAIITVSYSSYGPPKSKQIKVKVKSTVDLKEIILKPQDSTSLKTIDKRRYIKAFAVFTDNSRKDITKLKETKWNVDIGKGMAFFPEKGALIIEAICNNSLTVTASYKYRGKTKKSKPLIYKIHPDYAFVPWAITRNKDVAVKMIKDNKLVPDPWEVNSHNSGYSAGVVIYQEPTQCELVKKGTKVSIGINPDLSNKFTKVPDVIGLSPKAAAELLGKHRLKTLAIHSQTYKKEVTVTIGGKTVTRQIKPDHVVSQKPSAEKTVKQGSEVVIVLNYGWATPMVKVPDLIGKTESYAYSILPKLRLGLKSSLAPSFNNSFNPGEIITQDPAKDKEVPVGTTVFVTINPSQPKLVKVPDLLCMTESKAQSTLSKLQLGIQPNLADSHDSQCSEGEVVEQDPQKGKLVAVGTAIKVLINPAPKALIGIKILLKDKILPKNKRSYPLNTKLTFKEDVKRKNIKKNTYTFKWYVDGKKISDKSSFTYTFTQPGSHYVMLDMESSDSNENDKIRTNINIEYPDPEDIECGMTFGPPLSADKKKYVEGDRITFIQSCKNIQKATEFRWYVNDRYVGSGKKVTHTFNEQGTYKIKLGLRMGSNYDELECTKSITIGSGIGVLGNPNRFKARGGLGNLSVCSEYWQGGYTPARWSSKCALVSSIGPVDGYDLCTGDQSDGWNTGFLVYSKKGSEKLSFQVYHFKFGNKWKGVIHYSGEIPKAINPDPESIAISCRANVATVRWTNEDGSVCSTKIWKFKYSSFLRHFGVEQPVCSEPLVEPTKLKRCKTFAKRAVEQFNENLNRKCNLQGPEWHGDEERHKQWCINVSKGEAYKLTRHRDNALKNCGKTWCDSYAKRAIEQNEENIRNRCDFRGKRWQSDYNNHYNWCRSAAKRSADSETRKRDKDLQNCIRGREGPCKRYAETAVKQNEQNIQKDCGFCGQRWQSSFDNHFQWCLKQPQSARALETKAREKLLKQCKDVSTAGKRTFYEPCYNGYRLDNCLNFGTNCEKPAADKFCKEKGFTKATSWKREKARPTYIIGDRSLCDEDFCVGFKYITCSGYKYPDNINPVCTIKRPKSGTILQPGISVSFSADASDPDRDKLNYAWIFEGGRPDKWTSSFIWGVTWDTPGIYTATLTVTDGKGGTCTDTVAITVQDKGGTLDCDQYADKSVRQNEENLSKKCGFTGDLWHSNKSGHTHWCQNADQSRVAQNIATREKALNECKRPTTITDLACDITAPSGIAFTNAGKTIDFAGTAQGPSGGSLSYNWKFGEYGAEPGTSTKQNPGKVTFKWGGSYKATLTVTDARGKTCQATRHVLVYDSNDPREFCEGYAGISIEQNEENKRNNCGYSGEHWHDDELNHRKWCKSVSLDQARSGLRDRDDKLRKCTDSTDIPDDPGKPDVPDDPGSVSQDPQAGRLSPVADSRVYAYAYRNWNKANWGAYDIFTAGWHPVGGESRAYLKFDLTGVDPNSVGKATLKLFHYHTGGNNSLSVGVHAVIGAWEEGGGTYHSGKVEKPAAPGEITWVAQPPFNPYQSANFTPGPGTNNYIEVDITQLVKQWLSGVPNNGLVLKATGNLSGRTPESAYGFYSREHKDKSKRPVLILSASFISDTPTGGKKPVKDYKSIVGIPCGTDREFVYSMFQCIFERDPGKKEVDEQVRDLQNGMSRKDIVVRFFKSDEYNSKFYDSKSDGYYWTAQTWNSFFKDAYQAVFGLNRNFNSSVFPKTYHHRVVAQLFDTEKYRNLCPGKGSEYNPLKDAGMGIPDKIQSKDKVDALIKQYHDQQYHDIKKDDDKTDDVVSEQSSDYSGGTIGDMKIQPAEKEQVKDTDETKDSHIQE